MIQNQAMESIEWAATIMPHSPRVVQDAYEELLWAVLRGDHDHAAALKDALACLLRELRPSSPA